jgi:hypothetical protein
MIPPELSHGAAMETGNDVPYSELFTTLLQRDSDSQSPFAGHKIRLISQNGPSVSPIKEFASGVGAQQVRFRSDPDPAQVEPIRVPTCLERDVPLGQAVGMKPAGFKEQLKIGVIEIDERSSQRPGIFSLGMERVWASGNNQILNPEGGAQWQPPR